MTSSPAAGGRATTAARPTRRATPTPPGGLREQLLSPPQAEWQDTASGSLAVLPYEALRTAADPTATLLDFLESAYRAGAITAGWDLESFATAEAS
jgi:hypothetical protein